MAPSDDSPDHPVSPLRSHEVDAFFEQDAAGFGERMSKGVRDLIESTLVPDLIAVSRDEGELAGAAASILSLMTLPGLSQAATAMIVGVSVKPTHRRQGRLTALMRYQLDDLRSRGQVLAALFASEAGIYGRFGYGQSTFGSSYVLDKRTARLAPEHRPRGAGRVRLISREQAAEAYPAVYAAYAPTRAGELRRPYNQINFLTALGDPGSEELQRRFHAVYEHASTIDGYAAYEIVSDDGYSPRQRQVVLHELCCLTAEAYIALWGFLLSIDLPVEVVAVGRPVDEPIRWVLNDARQLRTTRSGDRTWVRLLDVAAALSARHYPEAGSLLLGVHDAFCPENSGTYRLNVTEEWAQAEVERTEAPAEIELDASTLGSVYLGGVDLAAFASVGRLRAASESAVSRGSRMFANDRPPFSLTNF